MEKQEKILTVRLIVQLLIYLLVIPLLPLLISRRWDWWEAWVFAAITILGLVISRLLLARKHPDLIAERARTSEHEDAEAWDKVLSPLAAFGGGLILLVAGFDALYGWSSGFSTPAKLAALALILMGYWLGSYALIENRFFSGVVRLQTERGHKVVSSGPYAWIRHPGYAGALLVNLVTPIFLDTGWGFVPLGLLLVVFVLRTKLEDDTLQAKLDGYSEYAKQVRYRLIPGIW